MNSSIKTTAAVTLMMALFTGTAGAAGNIRMGQMEIHPFLSLKEEFSDNIYNTSTEQKSDRIFVTYPGIKVQLPVRMHTLEAEYWIVDRRYNEFRGEDTTDQHVKGLVDLKFGSLFSLTAYGVFDKAHEPRSSSSTGFIEVYRTNSGSASAVYQLTGKSKVQLDYDRTSWNFVTSSFRDRDESLVSGYVYYRFLPKTSAFIEYDHKTAEYKEPTSSPLDNSMDSALLGLTWEVTARSKGTIKVGRTSKDYTENIVKDFSLWVWSLDIDHKFSEETSIVLVGKRQVNETNAFNTAYFITTGLYGEFSHRFMSKTAFLLRGSSGTDKYSNAVPPSTIAREDKTTLAGVGLKYFMKDWVDIGADYNKRNRDSNIDVNDYTETVFSISVNMSF
jgi:hypothetical protein